MSKLIIHLKSKKRGRIMEDKYLDELKKALKEAGDHASLYTSFTTSSCSSCEIKASANKEEKKTDESVA